MITLNEVLRKTEQFRDKLGIYVEISINSRAFTTGNSRIDYGLYRSDHQDYKLFDTIYDLMTEMDGILGILDEGMIIDEGE